MQLFDIHPSPKLNVDCSSSESLVLQILHAISDANHILRDFENCVAKRSWKNRQQDLEMIALGESLDARTWRCPQQELEMSPLAET